MRQLLSMPVVTLLTLIACSPVPVGTSRVTATALSTSATISQATTIATPAPAASKPDAQPVRGLATRCTGDARACEAWTEFRRRVPWPYQTLGLRRLSPGEYVVLVSEPAPTATRAQLDALLTAVFGDTLVDRARGRFPTGIDGWLEDTMLRVRVDPQAHSVEVLSGHDLKPWSIPAALAQRLRFVHRSLLQTTEGFYVDDLQGIASDSSRPKVPTLTVSARDVDSWLAPARDWVRVSASADRRKWKQILQSTSPDVYFLPGDGLIALALPSSASRGPLAGPLRTFGVASDITVAAVRTDQGGLVLVGRTRKLPLTVFPPMRLETLAVLQRSRGNELGQSYERGRIFAGKLSSGPAKGWDWAPIFLSSSLEDGELGTLLNLADQVLKSWSQHGDVVYYAFDYARPDTYPFATQPASDYFGERLQSNSLTFNWNTGGFTTWVDMPSGGIITPDRTSVLPITYIPEGGSSDKRADSKSSRLAREAADRAREAFAAQGDPMLARVAQHVLVFHALGTLGASSIAPSDRRDRTETVNDALRQHAERWLSSPEVIAKLDPSVLADIGTLRRTMGMNNGQIADLLANPRVRGISQKEEELQRAYGMFRTMFESGKDLETRGHAAFDRMCRDLSGTIVPLGTGRRCNYTWPEGRALPASVREFERLQQEAKDAAAQVVRQQASVLQQTEALTTEWERQKTAVRIASKVADNASATWEGSEVLRAVLERASKVEAAASIRTPSVVLSRDSKDYFMVGGHNIGSTPTRVLIGEAGAKPAFRRIGNDMGLVMSADQLRASADVVRRGVDGAPLAVDPAAQPARVALRLDSVDAPLRATLQRSPTSGRLSDAEVLQRFAGQDCGTCVLRDAQSNLYVLDKGPPTAVSLAGDPADLPGLISAARNREVVRFEGLPPDAATFVVESVRVADATARRSPMDTAIEGARRLFGRSEAAHPGSPVVVFTDGTGRSHQFTLLGQSPANVNLLKSRVSARTAEVFDTGGDAIGWLRAVGRSPRASAESSVTVARFGRRGDVQIDLGVIADYPRGQVGQQMAVVREAVARAGNEPSLAAVVSGIREELQRRLTPQELEFFLRSNAGDVRVVRVDTTATPQLR